MKPEKVKRIRTAAHRDDGDAATRAEMFDHCAVLILLDIIEKGHGTEAFEVLANHFPEDMPAILKDLAKQQQVIAEA